MNCDVSTETAFPLIFDSGGIIHERKLKVRNIAILELLRGVRVRDITFLDRLIADLQELPEDRGIIAHITEPLVYEWKCRSIADRERLLDQLDTQDRLIIERLVINREKAAALTKETGLAVREIYAAKEAALENLLTLRHGAAYRP